jgi:AcrR family transcriptional regulator
VQNVIPIERALAQRALSGRMETYAEEARRLIDAAFVVMARTGSLEPRVSDIVAEAGLSNQAFYRHFPSKDALLLAALADGQQRLVGYLVHRLARVEDPAEQIREWIAGVLEQARDLDAAAATRPFAVNGARLSERFPAEMSASRETLLATLRDPVARAGGDPERDTVLVHDLAIARMHQAIVAGQPPTSDEIEHLVRFCLAGVAGGARDGA